ncbi:spore germination protein [Paenibacillus sp. HN-1]|uniref:spore germination protein n=1 Tax=Paenibacillus TaxID=44249 RepID=UPI001CA8A2C6|nr:MULTISPECIES: spore germination protein [Paenibacillus]MBY9079898.1 spore germination protein [Paenibacillus sp. CGMCC 1.18879]MBY9084539.1 spore germination protein [Paenibacillus sinensis]
MPEGGNGQAGLNGPGGSDGTEGTAGPNGPGGESGQPKESGQAGMGSRNSQSRQNGQSVPYGHGGTSQTAGENAELTLSSSLDETLGRFRKVFGSDGTIRIRVIENPGGGFRCGLLYLDGMIDRLILQEGVIKPIINYSLPDGVRMAPPELLEEIRSRIISAADVRATSDMSEAISAALSGHSLLFIDGHAGSLIIGTQGWESRAISDSMTEKTIRGSREGFTETLSVNLSMIRRRVQAPDLKFLFIEVGRRSRTPLCICYLESLAPPAILKELQKRLNELDIDHILDTGYLAELIRDEPYSPFDTIGSTERPDTLVGKLMEGRIGVLIEGTPFALSLPFLFIENFQASEDYYINYYFASFNRLLRLGGALLSIGIPAMYVAWVTYAQEMVPTKLLLSIAASRMAVPFPTIVEAVLMILTFEILREAGARIPTSIGQAVSIVGALVLGQAAVDARIVSAPMVIVVGVTGITTLLNPRLTGPLLVVRFLLLFCSFFLGSYGLFLGMLGVLIHLMSLRSFGTPYMLGTSSIKPEDIKDTAVRAPWWDMRVRPAVTGLRNVWRQRTGRPKA